MNFQFEPANSPVFAVAKLILLVDNFAIKLIKIVVITLILFLGIFVSQSFIGLFVLLVTWEFFYQMKLKRFTSDKSVEELKDNENLANVVDLELAKLYLKSQGEPEKLARVLAVKSDSQLFLKRVGIGKDKIENLTNLKVDVKTVLAEALRLAKNRQAEHLTSLDVVHSLFLTSEPAKKLVFEAEVNVVDLENIVFWVRQEVLAKSKPMINLEQMRLTAGIAQDWTSGYTLETAKYTKDITQKLSSGATPAYLVGRQAELSQIEEILSRDNKKNVILVGEPGVGKSTIVYSLARKSFQGQTLPQLRYKRVLELSLSDLLSGADQAELEKRLRDILTEIETAGDVIFYIPSIEGIAGAPRGTEGVDITSVLLPTLQSAKVQVIGATTHQGFIKHIEPHAPFAEQFDKVEIAEPEESQAVKIAEQAVVKIEKASKINFTYKAVAASVKLSGKYMPDRVLPGKAIDLLEQAAIRVAQTGDIQVEEADIVNLVSEKKNIPLDVATGEEQAKLLKLEEIIHQRIVDQDEAVVVIAEALRRARALVRDDKKPIGTFLFLGPTGVGKTETAKALATAYFGGEDKILRFDMSEYQTQDGVSRLIGGVQEKGQLTEAVRAKPFSLILLDEIEKANSAVIQLFLQVFEDGRLTDAVGTTVDFSETLIIATSNAGAEQIRQALLVKKDLAKFKDELIDYLFANKIFTPEFLNRFDEVVLFKPLSEIELKQIVKIQLGQVGKTLKEQEITIIPSESLLLWLAKVGYDPVFGARPLRRVIQDKIEGFLAKKILLGEVDRGDRIFLDHTDSEEVVISKKETKFAAI